MKAFGATGAWRGWSELDPSVHLAVYVFDDRLWGKKVLRTRELVRVVQEIGS